MLRWQVGVVLITFACESAEAERGAGGGAPAAGTGGFGGSSDSGGSGGAGGPASDAGDGAECYAPAPDAASGCEGLSEADCKKHPIPCAPIYGKKVQTGEVSYAGCWTGMECVSGKWVGKAPGASESCGLDPAHPNECWLFNQVYAPDGWTVSFLCDQPVCEGAFGDSGGI